MTIKRRPWTDREDELLRQFHKEGKSDDAIAYIIGRIRGVVQRRRVKLGLKAFCKRGPMAGWKHTPESRARISAANRRRWADPAYVEAHGHHVHRARAAYVAGCFRRPPKGTKEYLLYNKICETLGPLEARRALGLMP